MLLISAEERKNSWTLSEQARDATPNGMQRLLSTTDWDPDLVRDDLQRYVVRYLGDSGGVLIIDETGFLKKGTQCRIRHWVPYDDRAVMPNVG